MLDALLATLTSADVAKVARNSLPYILEQCNTAKLLPAQLVYVLATAEHESKLGLWMEEFASGEDYEGRLDLGNTQPGDGVRYKGRGFVQITGRYNYSDWGKRLEIDLVNQPELALQPKIAAQILVQGMVMGTFTGKKLSDYINDKQTDFVEARRIINGTDCAEKIAAIAERYLAALKSTTLQSSNSTIDLIDVCRYWQELPHQKEALVWLRSQIPLDVMKEFAKAWRNPPRSVPIAPLKATPRSPKLVDKIVAYCEAKNYLLDRGKGEINIIYLEGMNSDGTLNNDKPNHFNDRRIVLVFENNTPRIILNCEATTEPGHYYTYNPMNPKGAARIAFGQYRAWMVGVHGTADPHEALVQEGGPVTVHRDFNQDFMRTGDQVESGYFCINQHWGGDAEMNDISLWSAGCLVGRTRQGHRDFMKIIKTDPRYLRSPASFVFSTIVIAGDDLLKMFP